MRFIMFRSANTEGLAAFTGEHDAFGLLEHDPHYPGDLLSLLSQGSGAIRNAYDRLLSGPRIDLREVQLLPPIRRPGKIICVGLNYRDHAAESGFEISGYPTLFARFSSSLIGHKAPFVRPIASGQLDYEGELVAVIGKRGRHVSREGALAHIAGYSIFNDASVRDYQFKTTQWTMGKNFDATGAFGPVFVTADELPPGAKGLRLETRLNGAVVQSASTGDMIFDVPSLVSIISEAMTLEPGDIIVTGTPSGVGVARDPKLFMKPGDVCEVEIEGIGTLTNHIVAEDGGGQ
jgi:acylpyruvate hydrolase